jgi:TolB protein
MSQTTGATFTINARQYDQRHPSLSPDGRHLTGYQSGYADVYVIDLGSGSRSRIINFSGTKSGATFSPAAVNSPNDQQRWQPRALHGRCEQRWRTPTRTRGESDRHGHLMGTRSFILPTRRFAAVYQFRHPAGGQSLSARLLHEPSWSPDGKKARSTFERRRFQVSTSSTRWHTDAAGAGSGLGRIQGA